MFSEMKSLSLIVSFFLVLSMFLLGCTSELSEKELESELEQLSEEQLQQVVADTEEIEEGMDTAAIAGQAYSGSKTVKLSTKTVPISNKKVASQIKIAAKKVLVNKKPYLYQTFVQSKADPFIFYKIGFKDLNVNQFKDRYGGNLYLGGLGKTDFLTSLDSAGRLPISILGLSNNEYWLIGVAGSNPNDDEFVMAPPGGGWCSQGLIDGTGSTPSTLSEAASDSAYLGTSGGSGLEMWTSCQSQNCEGGSSSTGSSAIYMEGLTMNTGTQMAGGNQNFNSPPDGYSTLSNNGHTTPQVGYGGRGAVNGQTGTWGTYPDTPEVQIFTTDDGSSITYIFYDYSIDDPKTIVDETDSNRPDNVRGKSNFIFSVEDQDDYNLFIAPELGELPEEGSAGDEPELDIPSNMVSEEDMPELPPVSDADSGNCETDSSTGQCKEGTSYCIQNGEGGSCPTHLSGTILARMDMFGLMASKDPSLLQAWVRRDLGFAVNWGNQIDGRISGSGAGPTGWPQLNVDWGREGMDSWITSQGGNMGDGCTAMGGKSSGARGEGYNPADTAEGRTVGNVNIPGVDTGSVDPGLVDPRS